MAKSLTHKHGRPKNVYVVMDDEERTILRIEKSFHMAMKHMPEKYCSILAITPNALRRNFGDDEIVKEFLEKEVVDRYR